MGCLAPSANGILRSQSTWLHPIPVFRRFLVGDTSMLKRLRPAPAVPCCAAACNVTMLEFLAQDAFLHPDFLASHVIPNAGVILTDILCRFLTLTSEDDGMLEHNALECVSYPFPPSLPPSTALRQFANRAAFCSVAGPTLTNPRSAVLSWLSSALPFVPSCLFPAQSYVRPPLPLACARADTPAALRRR